MLVVILLIFLLTRESEGKATYISSVDITLKHGQVFTLQWNHTNDNLMIQLSVETKGWIGIGRYFSSIL